MKDYFITDFSNPLFQAAFKEYFSELGVNVKDWDGLFREMNEDEGTAAFLRTDEKDSVIGFIQFQKSEMKHWFFSECIGFIREFYVSAKVRGQGHGIALLELAEEYFLENNVCKAILTTDTTPEFYLNRGYIRDCSYQAKNMDEVFVKLLKKS